VSCTSTVASPGETRPRGETGRTPCRTGAHQERLGSGVSSFLVLVLDFPVQFNEQKQPRGLNTSVTKNVKSVQLEGSSARLEKGCEGFSIDPAIMTGVPRPHQKPMLGLCEDRRVFYAKLLRWISGDNCDTRDSGARANTVSTNTPRNPFRVPACTLVCLEDTQKVSVRNPQTLLAKTAPSVAPTRVPQPLCNSTGVVVCLCHPFHFSIKNRVHCK
jgi:hypothetical protein